MDSLSANLQKKLWTAHKDPGRPPSYFYENSEELRAARKTVAKTAREMRTNNMALQDKNIMPPPWLAHREIERYSIGWRMGYGEDYIVRFGDWLDTLSPDERTEYRVLFPEPVTWKGWWDNEDAGEVLAHGDFLAEASPYDGIWGIRLAASSPEAQDPMKWRGQNLLGFALMEVRDELRRVTQNEMLCDWNAV